MQLQIFKYESEENPFCEVRTLEQEDGRVLLCASDVARVLGYKNPTEAVITHCKSGNIVKCYIPHEGGVGGVNLNFIPESEVYRLIIRSKLKSAEQFGDWLFEEVLPSIRNKGWYGKINRTAMPNFIERYKDNYHKLPRDYFSVISEMYIRLYMALERVGYSVPDRAEGGKQMMPDISVGLGFARFLKDNSSAFYKECRKYTHTFPDGKEVEANMYHIDALPSFVRYIHEVWIPNSALEYFKKRDPVALDYLPKLLEPTTGGNKTKTIALSSHNNALMATIAYKVKK